MVGPVSGSIAKNRAAPDSLGHATDSAQGLRVPLLRVPDALSARRATYRRGDRVGMGPTDRRAGVVASATACHPASLLISLVMLGVFCVSARLSAPL
jgi:hypothetical protein